MKKLILSSIALFTVAVFFNSCSIEKRQYMPGYYVDWKKNNSGKGTLNENEAVAAKEKFTTAKEVSISPVFNYEVIENAHAFAGITESKTTAAKSTGVSENVSKNGSTVKHAVKAKLLKNVIKHKSKSAPGSSAPSKGVLIILAILIPWLAVGLVTDWGMPVVYNLLWCLTCIGGIIHAIIVVNREA